MPALNNERRDVVKSALIVALVFSLVALSLVSWYAYDKQSEAAETGRALASQVTDTCEDPATPNVSLDVCDNAKAIEDGDAGSTDQLVRDGRNGRDGLPGRDGLNGINGSNGSDGTDGTNGLNGLNAPVPENGVDGASGKDGVDGVNGKDGVDGKDGRDGTDGRVVAGSYQCGDNQYLYGFTINDDGTATPLCQEFPQLPPGLPE